MDQFFSTPATHPVLVCADQVGAALDAVAETDPVFMTTAQKRDAVLALGRAEARIAALRLQVLAISEDVAELTAARSAGEWQAHELRLDPRDGRKDHALATAMDTRYAHLAAGMRLGHVQRSQAEVIVKALDALPADLDPEVLALAERHLVGEAAHFTPTRLRHLGHKLLETIDPAMAEAYEKKLLDDADERAAATTKITFRPRGDGTTDIHARVADHVAARLKAYLEAYTNPRRHDPGTSTTATEPTTGRPQPEPSFVPEPEPSAQVPIVPEPTAPEDTRSYARRLGQAFARLLEAFDSSRLPLHGGDATTLVVTIDHDNLRNHTGHATLSDGTPLSPAQTRRLACTCGILPLVLGGESQPLDLGRLRRLFSGPIRRALNARDRTCRATGCDHPGAWCEAHHKHEWVAHQGRTRVEDGVLLCGYHHDRAHDPKYEVTYHADGDVSFHLRQ